ncbi:MAG: c-type cytochrome [Deltaproteobacteria bacterium]|nr:c-type cytochrome [Deltaproteobacteria bacterium]MBW2415646.1 c-type cytochrome [Deltaproteobacteria bacterium]
MLKSIASAGLLLSIAGWAGNAAADSAEIYAQHCASCHGERRYGGYAPPLIPQALGRKKDADLRKTLLEGRPNTQMAGYSAVLDGAAADAMVAFMREPVPEVRWTPADVAASRVVFPETDPAMPASVDRENLILVVERGTGSVVVLNGDTLREIDRFETGRIHGGPKFDRAIRRVFAVTRDGTVFGYDLVRGGLRTKVKVAANTRNIALSPDGALLAAVNQLPQNLLLLDADLQPLQSLPLPGQPSGVYQVPGQPRFMLTLRDAPLLFFVPYAAQDGKRALQRVELPEPFEDFTFIPGRPEILASSREGKRIHRYDYARGKVLASIETEALPHLFSACFFSQGERRLAALNHIGLPRLSIVDLDTFEVVREIPLAGSGYFVRTHEGTPYLWADTNSEQIQLVDKRTLELAGSLTPEPGKKAMHVEFTKDGGRALVSVWNPKGAVVVYDSSSLKETARLPYAMPIGKYNAWNKTKLLR